MDSRQLDASLPIGTLAARFPYAIPVLRRHRLDFCCGGSESLQAAADTSGVDVGRVLQEIREATPPAARSVDTWDIRPLPELIAHIEARYYRPLDALLPSLDELLVRVVGVHGPKEPERFQELLRAFRALRADLEPHMRKEEAILFPWLREGDPSTAGAPIRQMLQQHETVAVLLRRIRELTDDYRVPPDACGSWRALWTGLEELEASLHEHIHLENNVLFPRALA